MALVSSGSGADKIAAGTTGERPAAVAADAGLIRFNSTLGEMERWDGTSWGSMGGGDGSSVHIGPTPPISPDAGDLWYNNDDGMLYVYYTDANSSQWVNCSPPGGGDEGGASAEVGGTPPAVPTEGDLWYNTVDGMLYVYYTDANSSQWVDASPSAGATYTGYKNILMNPNLEINQRGVTIDAAATGKYGPDRWKKTGGSTMTQIIESGNFEPGGVYTLSGTGITTQQIAAPASGNWAIPNISTGARKIQLEAGSEATAFERRPIELELSLCQRYYYQRDKNILARGVIPSNPNSPAGTVTPWYFPVSMRAIPTVSWSGFNDERNTRAPYKASDLGTDGAMMTANFNTDSSANGRAVIGNWIAPIIADAEL
jgi:hypothetical protein